jgi:hypothetical protein
VKPSRSEHCCQSRDAVHRSRSAYSSPTLMRFSELRESKSERGRTQADDSFLLCSKDLKSLTNGSSCTLFAENPTCAYNSSEPKMPLLLVVSRLSGNLCSYILRFTMAAKFASTSFSVTQAGKLLLSSSLIQIRPGPIKGLVFRSSRLTRAQLHWKESSGFLLVANGCAVVIPSYLVNTQ